MIIVIVDIIMLFFGFFIAAAMSANGDDHYESIEPERDAFSSSDVIRNR